MRPKALLRASGFKSFNPRIRKGCDLGIKRIKTITISFNPRIRKGCDDVINLTGLNSRVSIHASVKDATNDYIYTLTTRVSIHASVKDATTQYHHYD